MADDARFADIQLEVTEYEASILRGALMEFADRWNEDGHTCVDLRKQIDNQLPKEWL